MPLPLSVSPCTCAALRRLTRRVSTIYDRHLAATGLKTSQYSLLITLRAAPLTLSALAQRSATDRTTLTRNLAPLIRAGWVTMAPGQDARQRILALTNAGLSKVDSAQPAWAAAQTLIETVLTPDSVRALHKNIDHAMTRLAPLMFEN